MITSSAPAMPSSMRVKRLSAAKFAFRRQQRFGRHETYVAWFPDVMRACAEERHPGVLDVADDRDLESGETPFVRAYGQRVEQPLSGMRHVRFCLRSPPRHAEPRDRSGIPASPLRNRE